MEQEEAMLGNRIAARVPKCAAVAVSAVLATAALAVAGVDLPDAADDAFQKLGLDLPNQAGGDGQPAPHGRSSDVHAVIEATDPSDRGCEFGHAVATAARGSALPSQAQAACTHGKQGGQSSAHKSQGGSSHSNADPGAGRTFGQHTAERAKQLRDATPEQRHQFGQDTAEGAKQLGANPPAATPPAPQGGPGTGQTHSQGGQSTGDQASGGRKP